jgi:glycosyltransferase involved in cell wall biosynthesis
MQLSIIIVTKNSFSGKKGSLSTVLAALEAQQGILFETTIVDNGSTIEDRQKLACLIEQHPLLRLQLIERSDRGVAAARNSGFYRSEGQVVLFIDDDSLPLSADALLDVFSQADGAVYGYGAQRLWTDARRYPEPHEQLDQDIARGDFRPLRTICGRPQPSLRQKDSTKYLERTFIGNFGFVRRAALAAIGGWPEEFIGYGCEDDLMAFLLYRRWGGPQILSNLQVAHITHGLSPRSFEEYQKNLALYQRILAAHGVARFHIGDLLYQKSTRHITEPLEAEEIPSALGVNPVNEA